VESVVVPGKLIPEEAAERAEREERAAEREERAAEREEREVARTKHLAQ
jgi:hypothetical protein